MLRSNSKSRSSLSFYLPNDSRVCTSTSIGPTFSNSRTRTLTAALKRLIKQLLGTYSTTRSCKLIPVLQTFFPPQQSGLLFISAVRSVFAIFNDHFNGQDR